MQMLTISAMMLFLMMQQQQPASLVLGLRGRETPTRMMSQTVSDQCPRPCYQQFLDCLQQCMRGFQTAVCLDCWGPLIVSCANCSWFPKTKQDLALLFPRLKTQNKKKNELSKEKRKENRN